MRFRFRDFELDEARFRLLRAGSPVALRPMVFDLLSILVRERHRVVPKEELVLSLWQTTVVGEGSLAGLVNELRNALGESGRGSSSLRTVHARGYQFVAPIESCPDLDTVAGKGAAPQPVFRTGPDACPGFDSIEAALLERIRHGSGGLVLEMEPGRARADRLGSLRSCAAHRGVESFVVSVPAPDSSRSDDAVTDRVRSFLERTIEGGVDRWGIDRLRSSLSGESWAFVEQCVRTRCPRGMARDAFAPSERIRSSPHRALRTRGSVEVLLEVLSVFAEDGTLMLVVDGLDRGIAGEVETVAKMIAGASAVGLIVLAVGGRGRDCSREEGAAARASWVDELVACGAVRAGAPGTAETELLSALAEAGLEAPSHELLLDLATYAVDQPSAARALSEWLLRMTGTRADAHAPVGCEVGVGIGDEGEVRPLRAMRRVASTVGIRRVDGA